MERFAIALEGDTREGHPGSHRVRPAAFPDLSPARLSCGGAGLRRLPAVSRQACQVLSLHPDTSLPGGLSDWKQAGPTGNKLQRPQVLKSSFVLVPVLGTQRAQQSLSQSPGVHPWLWTASLPVSLFLLLLIISPGFDFFFFFFRTGSSSFCFSLKFLSNEGGAEHITSICLSFGFGFETLS